MRAAFVFAFTADGPMPNAGGVPRFLRWGHAEPLSESWVASLPLGWNRAYSGVRFTKAKADGTLFRRPWRVLPWLVRLLDLFQQRLYPVEQSLHIVQALGDVLGRHLVFVEVSVQVVGH